MDWYTRVGFIQARVLIFLMSNIMEEEVASDPVERQWHLFCIPDVSEEEKG